MNRLHEAVLISQADRYIETLLAFVRQVSSDRNIDDTMRGRIHLHVTEAIGELRTMKDEIHNNH